MADSDKSPARQAITWGGVAAVLAALYFARQVFIPLALAVLFSFLLAPLVVRLRHWGIGRVFSVMIAVSGAVAVFGLIAWLMAVQVLDLAAKLPQYQSNMQHKVQSFSKPGGGILGKATLVLRNVSSEIGKLGKPAEPDDGTRPGSTPPVKPVPVEIHQPEPSAIHLFRNVMVSLFSPLATAGIVVVFVIFMLLNREDLRDRLIRLIGARKMNLTTQALDDAAQGVSRFLLAQLMINLCYGIPIGIGLYFVGVPNPLLWAFMSAVLRFIPYLGPWLGASMPAALAFAVDPGWGKLAGTLGTFAGMELVTYNVLEPWIYGSRTGISPVAILAAAVFWTWLWGPIGLLLATPLTVCLVVVGRYVPHLDFFYVLLGDEPVLAPHTRFYQRLLATSYEEASELVDQFLAEHSVGDLFENVIIPALILAEEDRHQGLLDRSRERFVFDSTRELLAELAERQPPQAANEESKIRRPESDAAVSVLCLPAADEADELAGLMLIELLAQRGIAGRSVPPAAIASERLELFEHEAASVICISALPPGAMTPAKSVCKRLRKQYPNLKIVVGVWEANADLARLQQRIGPSLADAIVTTLSQAVEQIAPRAASRSGKIEPMASNEQERLVELHRWPLLDPELKPLFDRAALDLAQAFNVPMVLVSLIDEQREVWISQAGFAEEREEAREISPAAEVVARNDLLVIEDVEKDTRLGSGGFSRQHGIRFYAGAPLRTRANLPLGAISVMDAQPRNPTASELQLLEMIGRELMEEAQLRLEQKDHPAAPASKSW